MPIIGGWRIKYLKAAQKPRPAESKQKRRVMKAYRERNRTLRDLGYPSYREYLRGPEWSEIRDAKLRRFPHCLVCKAGATQVHHLDYSDAVLLGMVPRLLVTLCRWCHESIEFTDGEKLSLADANKKLRKTMLSVKGGHRWLRSVKAAFASI